MIDLACPNCGRNGSIPREKINTRLVCKKCLMVFHMNTAGRAVLGEPQAEPTKGPDPRGHAGAHIPNLAQMKAFQENLKETSLPIKPILIGLAVLVLGWGAYGVVMAPPESLENRGAEVAKAFADDDLPYLKTAAASNGVDDVVRWFDLVHPAYAQAREKWRTKDTVVRVTVLEEDRAQRTGSVEAFIYPPEIAARNATAETAGVPPQPVELHLRFALDGRGKWRLNGQGMIPLAQQTANATR